MRELIAQEKGDSDPWDLKLARGGLTDLDFIAQGFALAHGAAHPSLIGKAAEGVFATAEAEGLLDTGTARSLIDAHKLLNDIFQWQRLTIEGRFDAETAPKPILKRLSTVAGLPNETVLLSHLTDTYRQVTEIYRAVLK